MRNLACPGLCLALILGVPSPAAAQDSWLLGLSLARESFSGASTDTVAVPGQRVEVTPTPRFGIDVSIGRQRGPWEFGLLAGYAGGSLRARTDALVLDDRAGGVNRYRMGLWIGRRVATLDRATVSLIAGPGVAHWASRGIGNRTAVGVRVMLALRVPIGRLTFENAASFGVSGSPFRRADLPPGAETRTLRNWSLGAGLRLPL